MATTTKKDIGRRVAWRTYNGHGDAIGTIDAVQRGIVTLSYVLKGRIYVTRLTQRELASRIDLACSK